MQHTRVEHVHEPKFLLGDVVVLHGSRTGHTSHIGASREKATFTRQDGEDGVGVLIELSQSIDRLHNELAAERVQ